MRMYKIFPLLAMAFVAPLLHAEPTTEEVIGKARQYLGGDSALDRITSICYEADFEAASGDTGTIRIIFQKPMQQRVEIVRGNMTEISALNDFDGWRKVLDLTDEKNWSITLLEPNRVRQLQANTFENLNFFRGLEKRRGRIEHRGMTEVDGRPAVELAFHHPRDIVFIRYFDQENGRLLKTRTHEEAEIVEEGEIRVDGVLFPETITMMREGEMLNQIRFKKITLNEKFDDALFDMPSLAP